MAMIEVENLTKRYGDRVAVDNLSFSVEPGEVVGFLGPNGAGKSTTLKVLTGFLPASHGQVRIGGIDVAQAPIEAKRQLGYLPENPPLYPEMTVHGFLAFVGRAKGLSRPAVKADIERVASMTGLSTVLGRVIQNLSKGFRQRVGVAQALLGSPPLLILDEPTEGLDPNQRAELRALIRSLGGKHTVILSSHILPEVTMTCQKALIIHRGRKVAFDTIEQLAQANPAAGIRSLEEVFISLTAQ